ncbi:MAG: glycine/sarcosine/betaine reductase complex component C subunit beta [Ruthenibacterium sp.]
MNSVIKGTGYVLAHVPSMVAVSGTTQSTERIVNPDSDYLRALSSHLRTYEQAVAYAPNQTYIGSITPEQLREMSQPWYENDCPNAARAGRFGEIMPEAEFLLLMQLCDAFDLVRLERGFVAATRPALAAHPLMTEEMLALLAEGVDETDITRYVTDEHAEPLCCGGRTVGYVRRGHDVDGNLSAEVLLENIAEKASSVLAILHCVHSAGISKADVDYVIDCSEEACGDMNQRGGGNFAKAAAEIAGLPNATGCDVRAFCAAPAHALIDAASLVKAGTFKNVIVAAGGCTAKLGMNGKDHVRKGMPVLEDLLAGFAVLVSQNDGVSPEIDTSVVGRHTVATGSSPQAVITALVAQPLEQAGLKITDVDRFAPELQNPEITKPAGAGDVPLANYKLIGALAVMRGEIERAALASFPAEHGLTGWAPTQGHIPSGVPYLGHARDAILAGTVNRVLLIGKGSLFLGRMTNLFDGVSVLIRPNSGESAAQESARAAGVSDEKLRAMLAQAMGDFAAALLAQTEGGEPNA